MEKVLNDLFDYGLKIYQDPSAFKFSLDSILLAEFVKITKKTTSILDLCSGNASVPLILSTRTSAKIDGFEIQDFICKLAQDSIKYNNLDNQITIYNDNIKNIKEYVNNNKYDIITCNPPFFKKDENSNINVHEKLAIARHEIEITLEELFKIASAYLNDGGNFYMVHRVSRLDEIIMYGNKYNLNVKNIQLIKTKEEKNPCILLVRCIKGGNLGVKIHNPINVNGLLTYKELFREVL